MIHDGMANVMVASRRNETEAVPLEEVIGRARLVPLDHQWIKSARDIGVCFGD